MSARILIVEDEKAIQLALRGLLRRDGYDVDLADTGEDAVRKLGESRVRPRDHRPRARAAVLGHGRAARQPRGAAETAVVMITAHGSEKVAVEAMKQGAEDYVPKPFDNDELRVVVRRALERTQLQRENRMLLERVEREFSFENLVGQGRAMRQVFETIQKVAETDLTVLVRGESGTGKELVAQALHQRSARARAPVRRGQLRGDQPRARRERAVRPREGRVHRRRRAPHRASSRPRTAARSSSTRSATCRPRRRPRCCACSRSAASSASAATAPIDGRRARRRRDAPRPRSRGQARGSSARTSTTA